PGVCEMTGFITGAPPVPVDELLDVTVMAVVTALLDTTLVVAPPPPPVPVPSCMLDPPQAEKVAAAAAAARRSGGALGGRSLVDIVLSYPSSPLSRRVSGDAGTFASGSRRLLAEPDQEHLRARAPRPLRPDDLHLREQRLERVARRGEVVPHEELAHER